MGKTLKKIWNILSTVLVALVVLCAVFLMGTRIMGYQVYTVLSGSMVPEYYPGDLLYVKEVDVNTIKVDDPITFVLNEDLVVATHRVVRVDAENQRFYTKGDANEIEDSEPVHFNNVRGVPQFRIPLLGYVSNFVQNPPGIYITIGVGVVLIVLVFLPDMLAKAKKEEKAEGEAPNEEESADGPAEGPPQAPATEEPAAEGSPEEPAGEPAEEQKTEETL